MLVAVLDPLDRSTEAQRGSAQGDVLTQHRRLRSERTADVARHDAREAFLGRCHQSEECPVEVDHPHRIPGDLTQHDRHHRPCVLHHRRVGANELAGPGEYGLRLFALAEHVAHRHPHRPACQAHCHDPLEDVRSLMGCVQREVAAGVDLGHHASGLHRLVGVPVLAERLADHAIRPGERRIDVAERLRRRVDDVAVGLRPDRRPAGIVGVRQRRDRFQLLVLHVDHLCRILGHRA